MSFCDTYINRLKEARRKLKKYEYIVWGYKTLEYSEQNIGIFWTTFPSQNLGLGHKNYRDFVEAWFKRIRVMSLTL